MTDAAQFRIDLDNFTKKVVPKQAAELQRKMALELFTVVVQGTPVGNHRRWQRNIDRATRGLKPLPQGYVGGHARKNWQMRIGSPMVAVKSGQDKSGQQTLDAGYRVAASIKSKPVRLFIVNPLPYIQPLEQGHSRQAPNGWIKRAIALVTAKYRGKS
tara:strand:- start:2000 stop:2473 length:474 start_codon:yes stop_codon:yes gene_type:complete